MKRSWAIVWLAVVALAAAHLGWRIAHQVSFQTDLMALLPVEDRDPVIDRAKKMMAGAVANRIVVLVGHAQGDVARTAALELGRHLERQEVLKTAADIPPADAVAQLSRLYFPHRAGLLSEADRGLLIEGRSQEIVQRTLSQIYGLAGPDARLLRADPFLLLPAYLSQLPLPSSRLTPKDGVLVVQDGDVTWALVTGTLRGEAYSLEFQDRLVAALDSGLATLRERWPDLQVLRLGAVFYARAGAHSAMTETSWIGAASALGAALLIVVAFRSVAPVVLTLLSIGVGLAVATSVSLAIFDGLHVAALLFGAGLIGVAVDYSIHYLSQAFADRADPVDRLRQVLPGLLQGLVTTLVGFGFLIVAPFPGLRQIAVFSTIGVVASFLTVVLWFPLIDRVRPLRPGARARRMATGYWSLWSARNRRLASWSVLAVCAIAAALGWWRLEVNDDVRRQQRMQADLQAEEARVRAVAGFGNTAQFLLVRGDSVEEVLRREERLGERLTPAVRAGALTDWIAPARFAPSAARQIENGQLREEHLIRPHLAALVARVGMTAPDVASPPGEPLSLASVLATGALPFVRSHIVDETTHLVSLVGVVRIADIRAAAEGLEGVDFVDPVADISGLLGEYRRRALLLLVVSVLGMLPLVAWRHGWRRALRILLPPSMAALLTPGLLSLAGVPLTFFVAMALVLVVAIGVDYAVFCAEDRARREPVTVISLTLAMLTTVLSFGLLALSSVTAVQSFGAAMLVGILLAYGLAPFAGHVAARSEEGSR